MAYRTMAFLYLVNSFFKIEFRFSQMVIKSASHGLKLIEHNGVSFTSMINRYSLCRSLTISSYTKWTEFWISISSDFILDSNVGSQLIGV